MYMTGWWRTNGFLLTCLMGSCIFMVLGFYILLLNNIIIKLEFTVSPAQKSCIMFLVETSMLIYKESTAPMETFEVLFLSAPFSSCSKAIRQMNKPARLHSLFRTNMYVDFLLKQFR
uniref:Uncharacterized protein n=1 Tax=Ixodes ricinus TaxID=34613 RepID=A0A6B0ULY1_IXORI